MNIKKQNLKEEVWINEAGTIVPVQILKKFEKVNEKMAFDVATAALKLHNSLKALKALIKDRVDKAIEAFHADYDGKRTEFKGNYTIYNFDHSIKVEVNVTAPIRFDDLTIQKAKSILDDFLEDGITSKTPVIKEMVLDAFNTRRGNLDVKKVLDLKRYADRIDDARYGEAMKLIDGAIRRPESSTYYRVWVKNDSGKFENIALSLADV